MLKSGCVKVEKAELGSSQMVYDLRGTTLLFELRLVLHSSINSANRSLDTCAKRKCYTSDTIASQRRKTVQTDCDVSI